MKMDELTCTQNGDYLIPDLKLREEPEAAPLGKYGRMRRTYLKEHRPILFQRLVLEEKLYPHLREIDRQAQKQVDRMVVQLKMQRGVTEELKARDQMAWVQAVNSCLAQAEELVLAEIVYK